MNKLKAIRGAITIENNSIEDIKNASIELFSQIIERNNIKIGSIVSIVISCTKDITKGYPGKYIREHFDLQQVAIMHFNEMYVENYLPMCIRIMILVEDRDLKNIEYVYLKKAKNLREDLLNLN